VTDQPAKREKSRDYDLIGKTIADKYRVIRVLGQGGFGAVYLVEIVAGMLGEKLALKVLPAELSQDDVIRERFLNEIRVAMRLVNKYIVQIRDVGVTDDGQLYYTMDFSPGVTLTEIITANKQLPVMKTLALVRRVLRGLVTAHKEGVIHRDLKPGNLMVEDRGEGETIRILDFGIATALQSTDQNGRIVGSPLYMPPEQYVGHDIGFYTDLYSVGVILYECLSGQRPYTGKTPKEIFNKMKSGPPRAIQDLCPDVVRYPGLADVVMKALERDPARRYQSAQQLFNELTAVGKAAQARKAEAPRVGPTAASTEAREDRARRRRTNFYISRLVKVVLLLVVISGAYYYLRPYFQEIQEVVEDTTDRLNEHQEEHASRRPVREERSPKKPVSRIEVSTEDVVARDEPDESVVEPEPAKLTPEKRATKLLADAKAHGDEGRWDEAIGVTIEVLGLPDIPPAIGKTALEIRARAQFAQERYSDAADTIDGIVEKHGEDQVEDELLFVRFKSRSLGGPLTSAMDNGEQLRLRGYDNPDVLLLLLEVTEKLADVEKIKLYLEVADRRKIDDPRVKRLHAQYSKPVYTPAIIAKQGLSAEQAYDDGDYFEAIARSTVVFKETRDPNVGYTLARAYFAHHDHQGALDTIQVLREQEDIAPEQSLRLQILAGRAKIPYVAPTKKDGMGNHTYDTIEAQEQLRQALDALAAMDGLDKQDRKAFQAQIHTHLGLCSALEGNLAQTDRLVLRNKVALDCDDPELVLEQGLSYLILGRLAHTPKHRQSARERTVARMKKFNTMVDRGADPRGYAVMGIGYFEQGKNDYGKAIQAFKKAIRSNEKCPAKVRVEAVDLQIRLAQSYEKRGESGSRQADFRGAGTHFKNAFDLQEDSDLCFAAARNFIRGDRKKRGCEVLNEGLLKTDSIRLRQLHSQHCGD
jgi:serine/threonine protein kinase